MNTDECCTKTPTDALQLLQQTDKPKLGKQEALTRHDLTLLNSNTVWPSVRLVQARH